MRIETLAVHSGRNIDPATGAVTPPIHMSTTFEREPDGAYPQGFVYGRSGNPTRTLLEECLRDLEGGEAAAAFSSGAAALAAVFQSLATGDHVIAPQDLYHGTVLLLRDRLARWGLHTTFVDMGDIDTVVAAVTPTTKLILVETPSNPLLKITDIAQVAELAHERGIACVCDNTWATPVLQRCLELGADMVVHSTTKYLGGHGDVTGGAVISATDSAMFQEIRAIQKDGGAVPSPFDCWLILRGVRTLPYRMRAHSENAARVAAFLGRTLGGLAGVLPRASRPQWTRYRQQTDEHVRGNAVLSGPRRQRGGLQGRITHRPVHPGHEPGQLREPHRAPRLHRGTR